TRPAIIWPDGQDREAVVWSLRSVGEEVGVDRVRKNLEIALAKAVAEILAGQSRSAMRNEDELKPARPVFQQASPERHPRFDFLQDRGSAIRIGDQPGPRAEKARNLRS